MAATTEPAQIQNQCEIFEELLRCMVCFEAFKEPKVLHCQHSFCQHCLTSWHQQGEKKSKGVPTTISCPTCRKDTPLSDKGIGALPGDFKVTKLSEALKLVTVQSKDAAKKACNICTATGGNQVALYYCTECSEHFCEECCIKHNSNSLFTDHNVVDLQDVADKEKLFCAKHDSKPIKFMCHECNMFICTVCALSEHCDHAVKDLDTGVKTYASNLKDLSTQIHNKLEEVKAKYEKYTEVQILMKGVQNNVEEEVDTHVDSLSERILTCQYDIDDFVSAKKFGSKDPLMFSVMKSLQESASQAINDTGQVILAKLHDERSKLLRECQERHLMIMQGLNQQIDHVTFHVANIESLGSFLTDMLFNKKPLELLMVYDELRARIQSVLNTEIPSLNSCSILVFKPNYDDYESIGSFEKNEIAVEEFLLQNALHQGSDSDPEPSASSGSDGAQAANYRTPPRQVSEERGESNTSANTNIRYSWSQSSDGELPIIANYDKEPSVRPQNQQNVSDDLENAIQSLQMTNLMAGIDNKKDPPPPENPAWLQPHPTVQDQVLGEIMPGYSVGENMRTSNPSNFIDNGLDLSKADGKFAILWEKAGVAKPQGKRVSGAGSKKLKAQAGSAQAGGIPDLRWPTDACFLPNNDIVITDTTDKSIQVFSIDQKLWTDAPPEAEKKSLIRIRSLSRNSIEPMCVTNLLPQHHADLLRTVLPSYHCNGHYVATTDNKDKCIKIFDIGNKGACMASWGKSWFMPTFKHPCGIAITNNGKWVISDVSKHSISVHDPDGTCILQFGSKGNGNHWFQWPKYVAVDHYDRIIVTDCGNSVLKVFTRNGEFLFKFGARINLQSPAGIALDQAGNILVADWQKNSVYLFSPNGQYISTLLSGADGLSNPTGIAINENGYLVITQTDPPAVKLFKYA